MSIACLITLLAAGSARADDDDHKEIRRSGAFNLGLHLDAGLGVHEAFAASGPEFSVYPRLGLEVELGEALTFAATARLHQFFDGGQIALDQTALNGNTITPAVLYRFRSPEGPWAGGIGLGVRVGEMLISRPIVGLPPSADINQQMVPSFILSPDVSGVVEFWPFRWLAAKLAVGYALPFVEGKPVHVIEQAVMATFCL